MAKGKILVVDDEISVRTILQQILEKYDFEVEIACDGVEAMEKIKATDFNIVISDINMPNMDGVELLKKIKQAHPSMPIIFITAFGKDKVVIEAMKIGLADFIEKPFKMDSVINTVNQHIRKG